LLRSTELKKATEGFFNGQHKFGGRHADSAAKYGPATRTGQPPRWLSPASRAG